MLESPNPQGGMRTREVVVATVTGVATVVAVAAVLRQWRRRSEKRRRMTLSILTSFTRECSTPVQKLWLIADALVSEMQSALGGADDVDKSASKGVKLAVSYVSPLPTGVEEGLYYGVNLRRTDYLMLRARLGGKDQCISDLQRQEVSMPSNLLNAPAEELFEHIAWNLAKFSAVQGRNADTTALVKGKLGFTISHPVDQNLSPVLAAVNWRHFSPNDPGKELVDHFNKALEKHGLDLQVDSLVDETTGDLAGGRYCSKDAIAAVTLGMHTNVAYVQSAQTVPISIWDGPMPRSGEMVMNMDWGSFVSSHLPIGKPDAELDAESNDPACRAFEKLISGMYLGEIVRRVLLKMAQETALFGDCVPEKLHVPDLLRSPDMAAMHQDTSEDRQVVNEKLQEIFGISNSSPFAREVVADVCDIVAERAARLAGAGVVAIVKKLDRIKNKRRSVVIVEGGLYEHYRVFRNYVHCSIWEMLGREVADNVVIEHSLGGSGAGALFMAAASSQPASQLMTRELPN